MIVILTVAGTYDHNFQAREAIKVLGQIARSSNFNDVDKEIEDWLKSDEKDDPEDTDIVTDARRALLQEKCPDVCCEMSYCTRRTTSLCTPPLRVSRFSFYNGQLIDHPSVLHRPADAV